MIKEKYSFKKRLYYDNEDHLCLLLLDWQSRPSVMKVRNGMTLNLRGMLLEYRDGIFYGLIYRCSSLPTVRTGINFTEEEMIKILDGD